MGGFVAEAPPVGWYGVGAIAVACLIGLAFYVARVAYVWDLRRRRRMTPAERRAERTRSSVDSDEGVGDEG
jgi:hypothetical protein